MAQTRTPAGGGRLKRRITAAREDAREFRTLLVDGGRHHHPFMNALAAAARAFVVSLCKFDRDDCFTKASALTYTLILSLVPALAVTLTVASLIKGVGTQKEELFGQISQFMIDHSIKINIDPLFVAISSLVDNALKIGGISAVAMIFSATAMLRSLEKSLNDIWGVRQGRPLHLKIVYYWAAITLGPALLIAGTTVAAQIATRFTTPSYHAAAAAPDGSLWVGGGAGTIISARPGTLAFTPLRLDGGRIDFENQRVYRLDRAARAFIETDDSSTRIDAAQLARVTITDIEFMGDRAWALGTAGILLGSTDGGATWNLRRLDRIAGNDLCMIDARRGFIAADDGMLLETADGGDTWRLREWEGFTSNLTAVAFAGDRGIATAGRGAILHSTDGGKTWAVRQLTAARRDGRPLDIEAVCFTRGGQVWLAGAEGLILNSVDGGATWRRRFYRDHHYRAIAFANEREGVAAGDGGVMTLTGNGGQGWATVSAPSLGVNRLLQRGGTYWAVGETGLVTASRDGGRGWSGIQGGHLLVSLMTFLAPFAIIWLLFLLVYLTVPNTTVPFRQAAIGAAITGTLWVLFILGFIIYVRAFASSTFAVNGALAAIPLSLLMVYASTVIILYGAEVSYTLMHPETYRRIGRAPEDGRAHSLYHGMALLLRVFGDFEGGKKGPDDRALARIAGGDTGAAARYTRLFEQRGFIARNAAGRWVPATAAHNVPIEAVIALMENLSYAVPADAAPKSLRSVLERLSRGAARNRREAAGATTLGDFLKR